MAEIEQGAFGSESVPLTLFSDNMDTYTEDDAMKYERPIVDPQIEMAKFEVDELLSHRQKQVWRLCMRQGMTQEDAASELNISRSAVATYLKAAEAKIRKHFESKGA